MVYKEGEEELYPLVEESPIDEYDTHTRAYSFHTLPNPSMDFLRDWLPLWWAQDEMQDLSHIYEDYKKQGEGDDFLQMIFCITQNHTNIPKDSIQYKLSSLPIYKKWSLLADSHYDPDCKYVNKLKEMYEFPTEYKVCQCGHFINHNIYIWDGDENHIIILGSKCKYRWERKCKICQKKHQTGDDCCSKLCRKKRDEEKRLKWLETHCEDCGAYTTYKKCFQCFQKERDRCECGKWKQKKYKKCFHCSQKK